MSEGASTDEIVLHVKWHQQTCSGGPKRFPVEVVCPCGRSMALTCERCGDAVFLVQLRPDLPLCKHGEEIAERLAGWWKRQRAAAASKDDGGS